MALEQISLLKIWQHSIGEKRVSKQGDGLSTATPIVLVSGNIGGSRPAC